MRVEVDLNDRKLIEAFSSNLYLFNLLVDWRRKSYALHKKALKEDLIILGRWTLDTVGNLGRIEADRISVVPAEVLPFIPRVLSWNELWRLMEHAGFKREKTHIVTSFPAWFPPAEVCCPECRRGWTMEDAYKSFGKGESKILKASPSRVGQSIGEIKKELEGLKDGVYRIFPHTVVRNDKYIDLRPHRRFSDLVRNRHGWIGEEDGATDDYLIGDGDELYVTVYRFYHLYCLNRLLAKKHKESFKKIFESAGYQVLEMTEIPNEYSGNHPTSPPWFFVRTDYSNFKIGWRKRVINIDWLSPDPQKLSLFKDESVTKGITGIHAWGNEKATEYLRRIRNLLVSYQQKVLV